MKHTPTVTKLERIKKTVFAHTSFDQNPRSKYYPYLEAGDRDAWLLLNQLQIEARYESVTTKNNHANRPPITHKYQFFSKPVINGVESE